MKTKNNLTTGILLGIGVIVLPLILMSSSSTPTTNNEMIYGTPESHVWEMYLSSGTNTYVYSLNKETGEVRKYNSYYSGVEGKGDKHFDMYRVTQRK